MSEEPNRVPLGNPGDGPSPGSSPELKQLQHPGQTSIRTVLRVAGLGLLGVGLLCVIIAIGGFFMGNTRFFWLAFVGMPVMFVGGAMCIYGFVGAAFRFMAGETAPVSVDTAKYVAEETKGAVETVSEAVAKGVVKGIEAGREDGRERKD